VTRARLELLQWFALFGAPLAWVVQLVAGFTVTSAACATVGGVSIEPWQIALGVACGAVALAAQVCALVAWRSLRGAHYADAGPEGRLYFFSIAALFGNTLFLAMIALTAIGELAHASCRQS
jgi:hypothetical protein